jgi:hypothetical protein
MASTLFATIVQRGSMLEIECKLKGRKQPFAVFAEIEFCSIGGGYEERQQHTLIFGPDLARTQLIGNARDVCLLIKAFTVSQYLLCDNILSTVAHVTFQQRTESTFATIKWRIPLLARKWEYFDITEHFEECTQIEQLSQPQKDTTYVHKQYKALYIPVAISADLVCSVCRKQFTTIEDCFQHLLNIPDY